MKSLYPQKWWIEVEVWLVDKYWYPIFGNWEQETAYDKLIDHWSPDNKLVKQEVINHMVEMVTDTKESIEDAQQQMSWLLLVCEKKSRELWMELSQTPWIKINKKNIPIEKIIEYCVTDKDYYKSATNEILQVLKDPYDLLWAGTLATHIHMSAENDEATFELFKHVSNYAHIRREHWLKPENMLMNKKRFIQWNKIIQARKELWHLVNGIDPFEVPSNYMDFIEKNFFDKDWNLKRMHNIIALKKPGDKYTVELRSPDGINSPKQLQTIVQFTKCLVANALKFAKK